VIAEALAAGTPVITYDFGPMPEFVIEGQTGYIVPSGNIEALGDAIGSCLSNPDFLLQAESYCCESAAQFTVSVVAGNYLQFFLKITKGDIS